MSILFAGKYYVDLKNGQGGVWEGEGPEGREDLPDATIKINQENLVRLFNSE